MLRLIVKCLLLAICFGMDDAESFVRARGGDEGRVPRRPDTLLPLENMIIVSKPRSGKTTFLQWMLLYTVTMGILRTYYSEIILVCAAFDDDDSGWQHVREMYNFGDTDVSEDRFIRRFGTMTPAMWAEFVVAVPIQRLRLVIFDDTATDPIGAQFLAWLNGSQRRGGPVGQLRQSPQGGGAQADYWVVVQAITNVCPRQLLRYARYVMAFEDCIDDADMWGDLTGRRGAFRGFTTPAILKSLLITAFPRDLITSGRSASTETTKNSSCCSFRGPCSFRGFLSFT